MNILTQSNTKTMSSREIAELTSKQHGHVVRDIELLNETLIEESLSIIGESFYTADNGQVYREFLLTQAQTIDLMTGYNRNLRVRINRRWQELEQQIAAPAFQIPQTLGEALQLAANQALKIEQDAPKVNFYNTVADRDNLMTVTQVATKLGMSAQALNKRLVTLGAYDGRIKRCKTFTSEFIAKGYGAMKIGSTGHDQGLITQTGQAWIVGLFGE